MLGFFWCTMLREDCVADTTSCCYLIIGENKSLLGVNFYVVDPCFVADCSGSACKMMITCKILGVIEHIYCMFNWLFIRNNHVCDQLLGHGLLFMGYVVIRKVCPLEVLGDFLLYVLSVSCNN